MLNENMKKLSIIISVLFMCSCNTVTSPKQDFLAVMQIEKQSEIAFKKTSKILSQTIRNNRFNPNDYNDTQNQIINHYTNELDNYIYANALNTQQNKEYIYKNQAHKVKKIFTDEEIQYMSDFYKTDIGTSILLKKIDYDTELMEINQSIEEDINSEIDSLIIQYSDR